MRILSEGYRRVDAKGEGINKKARQSSNVKIGFLVAGVCISSFSMFTTTPAIGEVEGIDGRVVNVGGNSDQENLNQFKDWACNELIDQTLCEKYKDAEGWEDLEIDDIIEWKQANAIEDLVAGDLQLFSSIDVRYVIEHRSAISDIELDASVTGEVEFNRSAVASIEIIFDGGAANWETPVFWENMDVYWDAPESASTPYLAKVHNRNADASFALNGSIGTADYESTVFWEYMDVNWDDEDTTSQNQFFVPVHERDADASIVVNASVGTADYESTLFWEFVDVDWDEEDTSTGQQFFSTVHERNTSASISMSMTVGQAGWASDFIWEGLDINWDDNVVGQIHQGDASASINLSANSSSEVNTLYSLTPSVLFSLSTNLNTETIQGWNSETTFVENLNRNWEAI